MVARRLLSRRPPGLAGRRFRLGRTRESQVEIGFLDLLQLNRQGFFILFGPCD